SVALAAHEFEVHKVIPASSIVAQQDGRVSVVPDYDVHVSVIIEIGESRAPCGMWRKRANTALLRYFGEASTAFVVKKRIILFVMCSGRCLFHVGIHMSICDEKIGPAVVVVIEKPTGKTQYVVGRRGDSGLITDFIEISFAVVVPKMI